MVNFMVNYMSKYLYFSRHVNVCCLKHMNGNHHHQLKLLFLFYTSYICPDQKHDFFFISQFVIKAYGGKTNFY